MGLTALYCFYAEWLIISCPSLASWGLILQRIKESREKKKRQKEDLTSFLQDCTKLTFYSMCSFAAWLYGMSLKLLCAELHSYCSGLCLWPTLCLSFLLKVIYTTPAWHSITMLMRKYYWQLWWMHPLLSESRRVKLIAFLQSVCFCACCLCALLLDSQITCIVNLSDQHKKRTKIASTLICCSYFRSLVIWRMYSGGFVPLLWKEEANVGITNQASQERTKACSLKLAGKTTHIKGAWCNDTFGVSHCNV